MSKNVLKDKKGKGFTLIEVLVTVSLISLLSFMLYSSLVNGLKIWKKSQQLVVEEDVAIFFDKISRGLQNTFNHSELKFRGNAQMISFPSLLNMLTDKKSSLGEGKYVQQMGQVKYYFDKETGAIFEQKANYGQALNNVFSNPRKIVGGITSFQILYYYLDGDKEVEGNKIEEQIPNAVKVEVLFQEGLRSKILNKWINIPVGN